MNTETAEKLYEVCYMKVFSYVMTLVGNPDEAMEITQEAFFRAISTDKKFRGESESYTWLCAIAKNVFIDEKRRHARFADEAVPEKPDPGKDIETRLVEKESSKDGNNGEVCSPVRIFWNIAGRDQGKSFVSDCVNEGKLPAACSTVFFD